MPTYGSDISYEGGDMALDMRSSSGLQALGEALYRRLITRHGSWLVDRDYGYELASELNEAAPDVAKIGLRLESEFTKDERIESATATVTFDEVSETLTAAVECETALGPFQFTINASDLTVELLSEQIDTTLGLV